MAKAISPLLPATSDLLQRFGERLRLARRRRRLTAKQVAQRAGMVPMTLRNLERGGAGVTMGAYLAVMQVLGIEKDLDLLGSADPLGRELQDARLTTQSNSSMRADAPVTPAQARRRHIPTAADTAGARPTAEKSRKASTRHPRRTEQWAENGGFASAQTLADLIDVKAMTSTNRR